MNHDDAAPWVLDLHTGRLDAERSAEVAEHARSCGTCREVLDVYDLLGAAMTQGATAHPGEDELVELATADPDIAGTRERIDAHVASCRSCAEQVDAVRAAEADRAEAGEPRDLHRSESPGSRASGDGTPVGGARRADDTGPSRHRGARPADADGVEPRADAAGGHVVAFPGRRKLQGLAAGLAAALVLSLGYIGLYERPAAAPEPVADAIPLPLFAGAMRSDEAALVIPLRSGVVGVPLAVAPSLPRDLEASVPLRFEIVRDGRRTFALETTVGDVRGLAAASGVLALVVPAGSLTAGDHRLILRELRGGHPLLDQAFTVERDAP